MGDSGVSSSSDSTSMSSASTNVTTVETMTAKVKRAVTAMNGDHFQDNNEGEVEVNNPRYHVNIPLLDKGTKVSDEQLVTFMAFHVEKVFPSFPAVIKNVILACRVHAYNMGLILPGVDPATHFCKYNDAAYENISGLIDVEKIPNWFDVELFTRLGPLMTNIICMVAYVFRSKGHHYKDEYREFYSLKAKKIFEVNEVSPDWWQYIATFGLHAIFPDVLDNFWKTAVERCQVARPLSIRFHVPAAGVAGFFAIHAGVPETGKIFGTGFERLQEDAERLKRLVTRLANERWTGAINRKFYGAAGIDAKEQEFASLAAAVCGSNTVEDSVTDLGNSQSLQRIAKSAPLMTRLYRAVTSGMLRGFENNDTQNSLGASALKQIMFVNEEPTALLPAR